jgi:hypothetical protein
MGTIPDARAKPKPLLAKHPFRGPHPAVTIPHLVAGQAAFLVALGLAFLRAPDLLDFYYQGPVLAVTHLVALGWITMTIMGASFLILGVAHKMIPLLHVGDAAEARRSRTRFWLLNAGLWGLFPALIRRSRWAAAFAVVVAVGFGLVLGRLSRPLRQGQRRSIDWPMRFALASFGFLALAVLLGVGLTLDAFPDGEAAARVASAYGFLGLVGWMSLMIVGMSFRVVPLLVWMHRYAPRRQQGQDVPSVNSLTSRSRQALTFGLCVPGTLLGAAGLLISSVPVLRAGLALLTLGFLAFEADMLAVYRYLRPSTPI